MYYGGTEGRLKPLFRAANPAECIKLVQPQKDCKTASALTISVRRVHAEGECIGFKRAPARSPMPLAALVLPCLLNGEKMAASMQGNLALPTLTLVH